MDITKIFEKASKLHRLTFSNAINEAKRAKEALDRFLYKHGITLSDVLKYNSKPRTFIVESQYDNVLLNHIVICYTLKNVKPKGDGYNAVKYYLTDNEYKDVSTAFFHYKLVLARDIKLMMTAFFKE